MSDPRFEQLQSRLEAVDQAHVLRYFDRLEAAQQAGLLDQIESIDIESLPQLIDQCVMSRDSRTLSDSLEPAPFYDAAATSELGSNTRIGYDAAEYRATGEQMIRAGQLAVFTVAGGQGTRLGWKGPKGSFPATPVTGKPLFGVLAEQILAAQRRFGVTIPWLIMTSPLNDAQTRGFFQDNNCFGFRRADILMFSQQMMPAFDLDTGRILLAAWDRIALSPNGHGGSIKALHDSGSIDLMRARGIEHISYTQVDNPLVRAVDPTFLGLHAEAPDSSGEMSSKMVEKTDPEERVGVFCRDVDASGCGKTIVVEYSDLPHELMHELDGDGRPRFGAGSIAVHMLGLRFIERLTADEEGFALPWHRAVKKVPFIDPTSDRIVEPLAPNAVKLETFVFDAIPLADSSIVVRTERAEEFAPIKNADGVDSARSSQQLQNDLYGGWLERRGVTVPRDGENHVAARVEISPLTALCAEELDAAVLPAVVAPDSDVAL